MSKTSAAVKNKYAAKAYDKLYAIIPKGQKELFREACEKNNDTMNNVINKAVSEYLEKHS